MRILLAAGFVILIELAACAGGSGLGVWGPPPGGLAAPADNGRLPLISRRSKATRAGRGKI
jgi:hypothetical protein